MKNENGTIPKTQYIADYAFLDNQWNIISLVDVKGVETAIFRLKAKMIHHDYGLTIILAKKTRNGFIHYPFNLSASKRKEVAYE